MKNVKNGVAVAALMLCTVLPNASALNIGFDGEIGKTASFEEMRGSLPEPVVIPMASIGGQEVLTKLGELEKKNLTKRAQAKGVSLDASIVELINDEGAHILYNAGAALIVMPQGDKRYNTLAKIEDKEFIGLLQGPELSQAKAVPVCVFVEKVLWVLVEGIWTQVVKQVKECYSQNNFPPENNNGGSGSTYHGGQGGNSDYDVNKLIK